MTTEAMRQRLAKLTGYLEVDPANMSLLSDAAELALRLREWEQASSFIDRLLALWPGDPASRYRKAVILLRARRYEESLVLTQSLLDEGRTDVAIRYEHARGLAMASRFEHAEPYFAGLIAEAAELSEFAPLYLRTLHHLERIDEAIAFGEEHLTTSPGDTVVRGMLALLYLDNDDFERAAELSANVLEFAPNNLDALIASGSAALAQEDEIRARICFENVILLNPKEGRAWVGIGMANLAAMDLMKARQDLEQALKLMPSHLGTYNALAWVQILEGDYGAAQKVLDAALECDRNFAESHGGLAVLAAVRNDWDVAKKLAGTALRLDSNSFAGRFAMSLYLSHRGHAQRANAVIESLTKNIKAPGGGTLRDAVRRYASRSKIRG